MTAMRDTSWIKRSYPDLAYAPLSSAQVLDLYLPFLIQHGSDDDLVPVEQSMLLARALRGVLPETDVRFDVIPGSLHGGPAFETEENMARVFAFLSAALAPFGKAAPDKAS
jgi:pimeloyl-ACP methyl ester carboxylesterase